MKPPIPARCLWGRGLDLLNWVGENARWRQPLDKGPTP